MNYLDSQKFQNPPGFESQPLHRIVVEQPNNKFSETLADGGLEEILRDARVARGCAG